MKKVIAIIAAALLATNAWGQLSIRDAIKVIRGKGMVECNYSFIMKGDFPLQGNGTATLMGNKYHGFENGLETYSDGSTTWTIDNKAKEVVITKAGHAMASHLEDYIGVVKNFRYTGTTLSCSLISEEMGLYMDFKAEGIKTLPAPADTSFFSFDTSKLDSSWIVTDLR